MRKPADHLAEECEALALHHARVAVLHLLHTALDLGDVLKEHHVAGNLPLDHERRHVHDVVGLGGPGRALHDERLLVGDGRPALAAGLYGRQDIKDDAVAGRVPPDAVAQVDVFADAVARAEHGLEGFIEADDKPPRAQKQITVRNLIKHLPGRYRLDVEDVELVNRDAVKEDRGDEAERRGKDGQAVGRESRDHAYNERDEVAQREQYDLLDIEPVAAVQRETHHKEHGHNHAQIAVRAVDIHKRPEHDLERITEKCRYCK